MIHQHPSIYPGRGISIGQREARFLERSPAALPGSAQAGLSLPFKAISSRIFSSAPFRSRTYPSGAALERSEFAQALIDVAALIAGLLLAAIAGLGVAASFFILFFFAA